MPGESLIGNLAILLSMDTAAFEKGSTHAQKLLAKTQKQFEQVGKKIQSAGKNLSLYLTTPLVGIGVAVVKMAGSFETSMNQVSISTQATGAEFGKMRELALQIGSATTKSASEAAGAMDMLAKAGMTVTDILNGGAKAVVALAEATGSELDPAAAALTDVMQQFKKTTKELPNIINNITGAVNESKFDFADFQLGMAQAGGVASGAGVKFEDFTATLAATAAQFASGSDAGTSFKTFLMRLTPETKKQAAIWREYGLSFFKANGEMKTMAEVAQILQDKFGKLSSQDRTAIFKQMFGTDAIRTAIGLMQQGAKGIDEMQKRIAATDATAQAAQRMKGFNAEIEKLRGSLETLAIRIGDSGLLSALTRLIQGVTTFIDKIAKSNPELLKWGVAIAAVAAALGPLTFAFGTAARAVGFLLPILVRLGPLILALGPGAAAGATGIAALTGVLGPMAIAVAAVYLAFKNWDKIEPVIADAQKQVNSFQKAVDDFDRRMGIPSNQELINSLVTGLGGGLARVHAELLKFNAAMNNTEAAIGRFARNAWTSFEELWNRAVKAFDNMVTGIQNAVGNRLRNVFDGVKKQVAAVGDAFARLYDRVVGRSYVPDMIDGIAREMAKLDAVMTQPAIAATNKTAQAFRNLQQQAASLLNELFPEAAEANAFQAKLALTEKLMKRGIFTASTYKAALDRLYFGQPAGASQPPDLTETLTLLDPDAAGRGLDWLTQHLENIPPLAQKANDAFANIAQQGVASLADGLAAVLTGTAKLGDVFRSVAQQIIADLLRIQIQKMIVGIATSIGIPGAGSWFGGGKATGGPVQSGKLYMVGEKGPELFAPGRSGRVISNDNMGSVTNGAGDLHIHYGYPVSGRVARQTAIQADSARRQRLGVNARRGVAG